MTDRYALRPEVRICGLLAKPSRYQTTYCIKLHPSMRHSLGLHSRCVITSRRRNGGTREGIVTEENALEDRSLASCVGLSPLNGRLRAIATVIASTAVDENELQIDETLRTALAIEMDEAEATDKYVIEVMPLDLPPLFQLKDLWCRFVGYRHMYARVGVGFIADIDKPIGRVPNFAFPLLGVEDGGAVMCESAIRSDGRYSLIQMPLRVYAMSAEIQSDREAKEKDPKLRRFRSSATILGIGNELPMIYFGHDVRSTLNVGDLDGVLLRRSVRYVLFQQAINFGIVSAISTLALMETFSSIGVTTATSVVLGFLLAVGVPFALVLVRVRGTIR